MAHKTIEMRERNVCVKREKEREKNFFIIINDSGKIKILWNEHQKLTLMLLCVCVVCVVCLCGCDDAVCL